MFYGFLAEVVDGVHFAFLVFTLVGQLAILVGWVLRWQWVRNLWFRSIHVLCIVFVALEYVIGMKCPLTDLERYFRRLAGQTSEDWSFVGRLMALCFYPNTEDADFKWPYIGFAFLVMVTYILVPPRFRKKRNQNVLDAPVPERLK